MKKHWIILTVVLVAVWCINVHSTIRDVPQYYSTIQHAINSSDDGDTVLAQPGTYVENINFNGHSIVLASMFLMTGETGYIEQTVIDGSSSGSVITLENRETIGTIIIGFTITNGQTYSGGAGICCDNVNVYILYNRIIDNHELYEDSGGGGIYCMDSFVNIANNYFVNNTAEWDGGAIMLYSTEAVISGNEFSGNRSDW
jgi:hypothetical protein